MHPRETNPQQNQSASPGQAELLELPTTPATSREWHGRAPRKSAAATFSVLVGSYRGDLRKRRAAEVAQLSNGTEAKTRARLFEPEKGAAKSRARKSRTLLTNTSN